MNASDVIAAFGGPVKMAQRFGSSRNAVSNWRHDGIPAKFWLAILDAAKAEGLTDITREAVQWRPHRSAAGAAEAA